MRDDKLITHTLNFDRIVFYAKSTNVLQVEIASPKLPNQHTVFYIGKKRSKNSVLFFISHFLNNFSN